MNKDYMDLMERFPLAPLDQGDEKSYDRAIKVLESLMIKVKRTSWEDKYFRVLLLIFADYESKREKPLLEPVGIRDVVDFLVHEHNVSQSELARIAGVSRQNFSDYANGRRGLPLSARRTLAARFHLDERLFEGPQR